MIQPFLDRQRKLRNGWWILIFFLVLGALLVPATIFAKARGIDIGPGAQAVLAAIATAVCLALRREVVTSVIGPWSSWRRGVPLGLALGSAIWVTTALVLWVGGHASWSWNGPAAMLAAGLLDCLAVAVVEELVFRGFVFQRLIAGIGTWPAQITMAAYFVLTHSEGIASAGVAQPIAMLNIFLAGLLFGAAWLRTRSLAMPIALHFMLNFVQGPILGFGVSGNESSGLLQPTVGGAPAWWTGGEFGLEASLPGTLVVLVALWLVAGSPKVWRTGK